MRQWLIDHASYSGDECLYWPFNQPRNGRRPKASLNGAQITAGRAMCTIAHGRPPSEKHVAAHTCRNGEAGCLNPNHLEWKTQAQNKADELRDGTRLRGERLHNARLTAEQAKAIRARYKRGNGAALAAEFGVSLSTICAVARRQNWRHL